MFSLDWPSPGIFAVLVLLYMHTLDQVDAGGLATALSFEKSQGRNGALSRLNGVPQLRTGPDFMTT